MLYCMSCMERCEIVLYDDSFDHEFGTEKREHFGSDCCDEGVYRVHKDYIETVNLEDMEEDSDGR